MIIPTLNEEKFLPKLLNSLLTQELSDFEVLVVDSQSEDKTPVVVKDYVAKFQRRKIKLTLLTSEKKNVSFQRNLGAAKSRGSYLVFFDADVSIPPSFLAAVKHHIDFYKSDFISTWVEADSKASQDKLLTMFMNVAFFELVNLSKLSFAPGFNTIVSRKAFEKVGGFAEKVVHAEDFDLSRRLVKAGFPMKLLHEPRLTYSLRRFRHEGSLRVWSKYSQATWHVLFKGPITKAIFEYEMGGHLYRRGQRRRDFLESIRKKLQTEKGKISHLVKEIERLILYEEEHSSGNGS